MKAKKKAVRGEVLGDMYGAVEVAVRAPGLMPGDDVMIVHRAEYLRLKRIERQAKAVNDIADNSDKWHEAMWSLDKALKK